MQFLLPTRQEIAWANTPKRLLATNADDALREAALRWNNKAADIEAAGYAIYSEDGSCLRAKYIRSQLIWHLHGAHVGDPLPRYALYPVARIDGRERRELGSGFDSLEDAAAAAGRLEKNCVGAVLIRAAAREPKSFRIVRTFGAVSEEFLKSFSP
jgi:hypothetical protein